MADPVFNPPPGWPTPPPGWVPPPGWQPPSSWPAPPPGWRLWVSSAADGVRGAVDGVRQQTVLPEPFTAGEERRRRRKHTTATPLDEPEYVTRAITYPPPVPGAPGTRSTRHDAGLRSARSSGLRMLWFGLALAVVGGFLYATAPDPGQLVLSWVFLGVGGVQLLRGLGRWAKAVVSLAALPDPW